MKKSAKKIIATIILSISCVSLTSNAIATDKPYCTVASNKGQYWWTWTVSSQSKACKVAQKKLKAKGNKVNWKWRSHYSDNSLNKGQLVCHRNKTGYKSQALVKTVYGNGSDVFPNALNMANKLGWSTCYFKIK